MFLTLAAKSLINRKASVLLTIFAMTVSIFVLIGVEHVREQAKASFASTVSGTDLIVGAKTSQLNLLLYSVFRIGSPTNNISWQAYQKLAAHKQVEWAIPISLGDSHKGYRVLGTNQDYFLHYRYAQKTALSFAQGKQFHDLLDVVLGSEVAKALNYQLGDKIVLSHGIGNTSFHQHDKHPFVVTGILAPTGTPVDQTLHVSLQGIEAIHHHGHSAQALTPKSITAMMLGLKSKLATFHIQRSINNYKQEPLMAVLPGVALAELWQMMTVLENTLSLIAVFVLVAALLGLSAMLIASLRERQQELILLRNIGASSWFVFALIELEAILMCLVSISLAIIALYTGINGFSDALISEFGLQISTDFLNQNTLIYLAIIVLLTSLSALLPAIGAYKNSKQLR
ncbi:ABC transporter permease [Catenovulum sp. SM1970]|uniref:ABC transporter permease n=1 Tax=Marinifaba aquimaris TaxID=2741323 RepID=UPI00157173C4|nr:ABC transporter permease [Marinifaba aquimaris]NTS78202.1 ABC transporter permease [Marinifaba aquimaris]